LAREKGGKIIFPRGAYVLNAPLTILVISATAEHLFSKLKLIMSYVRIYIALKCLSNLSVLSIKNEKIRSLDILIDKFAQKNAKRSQKCK
jgi:hypothetical protein